MAEELESLNSIGLKRRVDNPRLSHWEKILWYLVIPEAEFSADYKRQLKPNLHSF